MNILESIRTAWKSIFANKLRSSLTMLGIIIGVSAVVLLVALGNGFQKSMQQLLKIWEPALFMCPAQQIKQLLLFVR